MPCRYANTNGRSPPGAANAKTSTSVSFPQPTLFLARIGTLNRSSRRKAHFSQSLLTSARFMGGLSEFSAHCPLYRVTFAPGRRRFSRKRPHEKDAFSRRVGSQEPREFVPGFAQRTVRRQSRS